MTNLQRAISGCPICRNRTTPELEFMPAYKPNWFMRLFGSVETKAGLEATCTSCGHTRFLPMRKDNA